MHRDAPYPTSRTAAARVPVSPDVPCQHPPRHPSTDGLRLTSTSLVRSHLPRLSIPCPILTGPTRRVLSGPAASCPARPCLTRPRSPSHPCPRPTSLAQTPLDHPDIPRLDLTPLIRPARADPVKPRHVKPTSYCVPDRSKPSRADPDKPRSPPARTCQARHPVTVRPVPTLNRPARTSHGASLPTSLFAPGLLDSSRQLLSARAQSDTPVAPPSESCRVHTDYTVPTIRTTPLPSCPGPTSLPAPCPPLPFPTSLIQPTRPLLTRATPDKPSRSKASPTTHVEPLLPLPVHTRLVNLPRIRPNLSSPHRLAGPASPSPCHRRLAAPAPFSTGLHRLANPDLSRSGPTLLRPAPQRRPGPTGPALHRRASPSPARSALPTAIPTSQPISGHPRPRRHILPALAAAHPTSHAFSGRARPDQSMPD